MAKGIFLVYDEINMKSPDGIEQKIISQVEMFRGIGIDMQIKVLHKNKKTRWNYEPEYVKADFIYFRRGTTVDARFVSFFKRIKREGNPIIFMEIPTYPYEGEGGQSFRSKIKHAIDHYYRRKLYQCIDRIVVTGADVGPTLWNIPTVCIVNGIDLSKTLIRKYQPHGDTVIITCVAKFSPWHGYERIIKGLAEYYKASQERKVYLLMVGEGVERSYYENMVNEYHLNDYVSFVGKKTGTELEEIYNRTDIGVCSLGRYKSNIDVIGDLKSREFMAKGIPVICGCKIDVLEGKNFRYAMFFPNNDSIINIWSVLRFYDDLKVKENEEEISSKIRLISKSWIDYQETFKRVLKEARILVLNENN